MIRWVVLGSSALAVRVADALADRPGDLVVVTADGDRASALLDAGLDVREADPADEAAFDGVDDPAVVAALDADGARNRRLVTLADAMYPDAHVVGYTGEGPDSPSFDGVADSVVDPGQVLAGHLLDRVGDGGVQVRQLHRVLRDVDRLAVVTHDNPDPDAIASAVALARIAEGLGCEADVRYWGAITHQENRAFVNLLEYDLENVDPGASVEGYDGIALVDHSRPGVNDQLPPETDVDIVIDHHPPRLPVEATFVDLRSDVGATSTLLVDYLEAADRPLDEDVATGLLFGIRVDTDEFTREVSVADFEAAAALLPDADLALLERVESPSVSGDTLETIADAIRNRRQEGSVLMSCVGRLTTRDALSQAADRLLTLDGVSTTLVYGVHDGTIYLSARARGTGLDLGEILRDGFDQIGSAGGHADMAGAQITLGVLETVEDQEESLLDVVEVVVAERFLEALEAHAEQTVTGVYAPKTRDVDDYLVPAEQRPDPADDGSAE